MMTLETLAALRSHERFFYCGKMTTQAITFGYLSSFGRYPNRGRIIPQGFMIKISHSGLGLVGYPLGDVTVRHVTFYTGKLLVLGLLPLRTNVFHAVAGYAERGSASSMISPNGDQSKQYSDNCTCSEKLDD